MLQTSAFTIQCFTAVLVSAFGGLAFVYFIKKYLIETSMRLRHDVPGVAERMLITLFTFMGGPYLWLIPFVILIKGAVLMFGLSGLADFLSREEPSLAYQRVRLKASLAVDLILSPAIAILVGILLKSY
jgi:hypothetical protein